MAFVRHDREGLVYFTIPTFDDTGLVKHCFTTKIGGFSNGIVKGLNLGFSRPDTQENVRANFNRLCHVVGIDSQSLVLSHQTHGKDIRMVTSQDDGKGIWRDSDIRNTDGLITNDRGLTLTTFYADCVPLFFLDPKKKSIGLTHAGWKGTVAGIGEETVAHMGQAYDCQPADILVGIGPSICRDCYEVDSPVLMKLKESFKHWREVITPLGKDKYLFDLKQTNMRILIEHGIKEENITDSGWCTRCSHDIFYSYRREGKETGSLAALMQLI